MAKMTKGDREELGRILRKRTTVAKAKVEERGRAIVAEFERQLATIFEAEDAAWRDLTATANAGVKKLDAMLAQRCDAMGIPREFRPSLNLSWYGRGSNASPKRRGGGGRAWPTPGEGPEGAALPRPGGAEMGGRPLLGPGGGAGGGPGAAAVRRPRGGGPGGRHRAGPGGARERGGPRLPGRDAGGRGPNPAAAND